MTAASGPERGRRFWKLCGSGNDFVFFDARLEPAGDLATPAVVGALCARGTGVGADGVVLLEAVTAAPTAAAATFAWSTTTPTAAGLRCAATPRCAPRGSRSSSALSVRQASSS
jgi:diaminopimelate epimerase